MKVRNLQISGLFFSMIVMGSASGAAVAYISSLLTRIDGVTLKILFLGCMATGAFMGCVNFNIIFVVTKRLKNIEKRSVEYRNKAYTDDLTGLFNRRAFDRDIAAAFKQANQSTLTLAFLDIDNFRLFNNKFGHSMGDTVLKKVAHQLKNSVRSSDKVYRYGGEEFIIILENTEKNDGLMLADRIRAEINNLTLVSGDRISVSIGVASYPDDANTVSQLINNSDKALYCAKHKGKNVVSIYEKLIG